MIDWQDIREKAGQEPWAGATVEALRAAFEKHRDLWPHDPPMERSEWTHHYFCSKCGVALGFDFARPRDHICPACGERYEGEPWDGVWRTMVHGSIAVNLERAALLARLFPAHRDYLEYLREVILFYATHYLSYEVHGERVGKGRILPQCLDEAIFVIALGRALSFGRGLNWFTPEEETAIAEGFFRPAAELLQPQIGSIHNIHAWMDSALIVAGYHLGDEALVDFAINGTYGWKNQVSQGVNEDGFWFEGAMTYHFYTFNALYTGAWAAAEHGLDLFSNPKLFRMLEAPLSLVYPNGILPAHNDCWNGVTLLSAAGFYEFASKVRPEADFNDALARIYNHGEPQPCAHLSATGNRLVTPPTGWARNSVAALLVGSRSLPDPVAPRNTSRLLQASGIGVLENENVRVCMRFTPYGGSHDHRDKLGIDVFAGGKAISADLGTTGYAAAVNSFYRSPAAHNMVAVNGERAEASDGKLMEWGAQRVVASADAAFPGVAQRREISLNANGWLDRFIVESEFEAQLDWIFHCCGELTTALTLTPADPPAGNGYAHLTQVKSAVCDSAWQATWTTPVGDLTLSFRAALGTEIICARCPDNPATGTLGIILVRRNAAQTVFDATFELH